MTKEIITKGRCEDGLYVLEQGNKAFLANLKNTRTSASVEIWHSRLGHVSFDIISLLQKLGCLSLTSVLPKHDVFSPCQMSKTKRLPFQDNDKRSSHILDVIHFDLWGLAPLQSRDGFLYYVIFYDHSQFTWF